MILVNWVPVGAPVGRGGRFRVWAPAWAVGNNSQPASGTVSLKFKRSCPKWYVMRLATSHEYLVSGAFASKKKSWHCCWKGIKCPSCYSNENTSVSAKTHPGGR